MSRVLPILFNTDMVRAILDGRKTVTRRLVKPQPPNDIQCPLGYCADGDKNHIGKYAFDSHEAGGKMVFCKPPCKVGDILYVRETWNICNMDIEEKTITFIYRADESEEQSARTVIVSDEIFDKYSETMAENNLEWRPSLHMPKEATRIFLKVNDVRVERLQDITKEGIEKEGLKDFCKKCRALFSECDTCMNDGGIEEDFKDLWNSTIKKSDRSTYGWDANPWVWVIEFERCDKPEE